MAFEGCCYIPQSPGRIHLECFSALRHYIAVSRTFATTQIESAFLLTENCCETSTRLNKFLRVRFSFDEHDFTARSIIKLLVIFRKIFITFEFHKKYKVAGNKKFTCFKSFFDIYLTCSAQKTFHGKRL